MDATGRPTVLRTLARFGRPHRRVLAIGVAGSAAWVACRLAMPWPLRGVMELVFAETGDGGDSTVLAMLPAAGPPLLWLLGAYVAVIALLGVAEMVQRLHMTKFATRTTRDLRASALRAVAASRLSIGQGELVVRLVSDVARVKADLKGILVHATQNGLLFASICILFLFLSPFMALFLVLGGALTVAIGFFAARRVEDLADDQREREGAFAASLVEGLATGQLRGGVKTRETSARDEGQLGHVVTASSLLTHVALALTVAAALAVGVGEVRSGALDTGELFLFIAYALMVHRRLIQLGRQLVRVGKLRANLGRLAALVHHGADERAPRPLVKGLELAGVRLDSARGGRPLLAPANLEIAAGARVAIVGKSAAGKSTLLRLLAGLEQPSSGAVTWDGVPLAEVPLASIAHLPQATALPAQPVWQILGLDGPELVPAAELRVLEDVGAWDVVQDLPRGVRQVVSSRSLSEGEARALLAGRLALGGGSLWLLDAPDAGLGAKEGRRRLGAILERAAGRTLIATFGRLRQPDRFTRVIALKRGKVVFDGTPLEWRAWRARAKRASAAGAP